MIDIVMVIVKNIYMRGNKNIQGLKITTDIVRSKCERGKLLNQYLKIGTIGQGPFSKIKHMIDTRDEKSYAMKKYNMFILRKKIKMGSRLNGQTKYSTQADQVLKQVEIMKKLNHKYIVKLHQILQDDQQEKIYLFMDYCKFGEIAEWNHKKETFSIKWELKLIAKLFRQAAQGLSYLHSINIVHRDIKPQNILVFQDYTVKLIDFGRSVQLTQNGQKLVGSQGTYHFMAPEMLSEKIVGGYNGKLCDIWSLGVSLFCCVFGCLPFNDDILMKLFDKIEKGEYKVPKNVNQKQKLFISLINEMIQVDWNKRANLTQICQQLRIIEEKLEKF